MNCQQPGCPSPPLTRGYCSPHYRRRLHTGRYGYRDGATARAHVAELRRLNWTWEAIGQAAGVSAWIAHKLHQGTTRRLLAESEAALLSVPLEPHESQRGVSAIGSARRVQALAWSGWPNHEIARRIGCSPRSLPTLLSRGSISARLALRISAVYEELSGQRGPSAIAAAKARQLGFAPPLAWDDETIDSPRVKPQGVQMRRSA